MSFIWGGMLWLLLLVPVLVVVYLLIQRRRQRFAIRYSSLSLVKEAMGRGPGFRRHIPPLVFLAGLIVAMIAMARPAATVILPSQQGTVVLTFDVSGSMRADDIKPSRLEAAKAAARTFVQRQPSDVRIGVVSFSDFAALVQAPTKDRNEVLAAINRLSPQRRTAIGSGIVTSLDAIFESGTATQPQAPPDGNLSPIQPTPAPTPSPVPPGSDKSAVIVLLSDGQSNTGPAPLDAAQQAADRGVRICTVGLGSPQGTVLRTQGFAIRVQLDENTLKRIAQDTAGQYFNAQNETDLSRIYGDLSSQLILKPQQTEITAFFTAASAALLLAAGILSMLWFHRLA
jgi:Ca-activated chloride channel family protein